MPVPRLPRRNVGPAVALLVCTPLCLGTVLILVAARARAATGMTAQTTAGSTTSGVVQMKEFRLPSGTAIALEITGGNGAPLAYFVRAPKGCIVCRSFDLSALDSRGVAAAQIGGLTGIDSIPTCKVVGVTKQARALGVEPGMLARDALLKLM